MKFAKGDAIAGHHRLQRGLDLTPMIAWPLSLAALDTRVLAI
jgi:hypothetical protein